MPKNLSLPEVPKPILQQMVYDLLAQSETQYTECLQVLTFVMARVLTEGAVSNEAAYKLIEERLPDAVRVAYDALRLHLNPGEKLH